MSPELEGTQTAADKYQVTARPAYGKPITLYVEEDPYTRYKRNMYVRNRPDSTGFITKHSSFEAAVKSANYRAKRYLRAYSKPRGTAAKVAA